MGYKLITTEKKSVAEDIAKVVNATNTSNNGYIEGNGYIITWAQGHLVGLAEPEEYGFMSMNDMFDREHPENAQKALNELPLFPERFKLIVLKSTKRQFEIIKNLMHRDDVDYIIDAGDAGNEGHILQWFIRVKAGCTKPVKRFIAVDMEESALRSALNNLQDIKKYENIIKGELCKKKADWELGLSVSRAASIVYNANITGGRVQFPTLYFVVERYLKNKTFKPTKFYTLECELDGFTATWSKDTNNVIEPSLKDEAGRLLSVNKANELKSSISGQKGKVIFVEKKKKAINRPQLYDTMDLCSDGNRIFGYTTDEVLNTAEKLYVEYKITTYPRTDTKYITNELAQKMNDYVTGIAEIPSYSDIANDLLHNGLNIDKRIINNSEVDDHHAIIVNPNIKTFDLTKLGDVERNILHLIICRMLIAFSTPYKYEETNIAVQFENGIIVTNTIKVPIDLGFEDLENKLFYKTEENLHRANASSERKANFLSSLSVGDEVVAKKVIIKDGKTSPPPLYTEADLLTAMKRAGDRLGEHGKILKGKGIGTQATRVETIKTLFQKEYIARKGERKTKYIIPTTLGLNIIKVLPKELYSPALTAEWENKIALIQKGELTEEEFLSEFNVFLIEKVNELKQKKLGVDFSNSLGVCPWCKQGKIFEKDKKAKNEKPYKLWFCNNNDCDFRLLSFAHSYMNLTYTQITTEDMKKLLKKGNFVKTVIYESGAKKKYEFRLGIQSEGQYKGQPKLISKLLK